MQTLTKTDFNIQRNFVSFYYTFRYVVYQKITLLLPRNTIVRIAIEQPITHKKYPDA